LKGFQKHRVKYADKIEEYNITESSSISECQPVSADSRTCQDMVCGICFVVVIVAWIALAGMGVAGANFSLPVTFKDSTNTTCSGDFNVFYINFHG